MNERKVAVYFIGAGPGDPELITVKGQRIIQIADLVLYAGSLVPKELVSCAGPHARVLDSSPMTLEQTHTLMVETVRSGGLVARVHTGDPSLYGAVREQMVLLDKEGITYEIIPGVTAAFAAAAAANVSFTIPRSRQSLIFTRMEGRTRVRDGERLESLASHNTSMAIYLSASDVVRLQERLLRGGYPPETMVVVGYRVGWPDQVILRASLKDLADSVKERGIRRQAVFLVLPGEENVTERSRLYSTDFSHGFRK